ARFTARLSLKPYAEPAVRLIVLLETARRDGVGKNEEGAVGAKLLVEALDEQAVLVIEHRLQTFAADVPLRRPVDRVTEGHVVRRHRLGHRAGRAPDMEKPPRHFLSGADLGERAVLLDVEIDLERL